MITPEIRELQVFLSLVRAGSFSAAAQQLGVTQPAVSAQIVKLEQVVGFPLFYRCPDGTMITDQGRDLVPLVEEIVKEHTDLLRRAAYWKRSQTKQVKIRTDGSKAGQEARMLDYEAGQTAVAELWQDLEPDNDWSGGLRNLEVDIVLAGSFLKVGDVSGIKTLVVRQQRGITIAWSPTYYVFNRDSFSLADAISSTPILPARSLAIGFREFLTHWCKSLYGLGLDEAIECQSEMEAVNACKHGLGVMIFPGDAEERMKLKEAGLEALHAFEFVLPKAFTFGIRYRAEEQNPQILATVARLSAILKPPA
ncbi:MAG: LysR family transcriptional regulator [Luteolibacter sp.]|uniref:LysR family transcriptional regulator n=1 Tax=Luteolibacter sp. TaxID=1962973 RepID=UPI003263BA2A